mgnify:CR=1 FL=1
MRFSVGEYAVCPGHGVGQVCNIEKKTASTASVQDFYIVRLSNGLKVMVPVGNNTGIRKLASEEEISEVFNLLSNHEISIDNSTWNRRYREYSEKIKSGDLLEIADVLRSLSLLGGRKQLSFGEKKMLNQCRDLLVQEIAISKGNERPSVSSAIDSCFQKRAS